MDEARATALVKPISPLSFAASVTAIVLSSTFVERYELPPTLIVLTGLIVLGSWLFW